MLHYSSCLPIKWRVYLQGGLWQSMNMNSIFSIREERSMAMLMPYPEKHTLTHKQLLLPHKHLCSMKFSVSSRLLIQSSNNFTQPSLTAIINLLLLKALSGVKLPFLDTGSCSQGFFLVMKLCAISMLQPQVFLL